MLWILLRVLALIALVTTAAAQEREEGAEEFRDPELGFVLKRPAGDWSFTRAADDSSVQRHVQYVLGELEARLSVTATKTPAAPDAETLRTFYREAVETAPGVSDVEEFERTIGGRETVGLSMRVESGGVVYSLRHSYSVADGRQFVLEDLFRRSNATKSKTMLKTLDGAWEGFEFLEVEGPSPEQARLAELAGRCGSEVVLAEDWASASKRARAEGKRILVCVHLLPGFDIENPWLSGGFMTPEYIDLFNERYVTLLYRRGLDAPFERQDVYGMSRTSFGTTLLVVDPDGNVLGETLTDIDAFLRAELASRPPGVERIEPFQSRDPIAHGERFVRRGEFELAREVLAQERSARAHLLEAEMARRELELEAWGEALGRARSAADAGQHAPEILLASAEHALSLGQPERAEAGLEALIEAHPAGEAAREAAYLLGAIDMAAEDFEGAERRWTALCDEEPESRWAWKAAAKLQSTAWQARKGERLHWPPAEYFLAGRHPAPEPGREEDVELVVRQAVQYLVDGQRADGTWICPGELGDEPWEDEPLNLTEAITCLAARSLLAHREHPGVTEAVERALDHVIRRLEHDLSQELERLYMDYAVWNRASQVLLFCDALELGFGEPERVGRALELALGDLRARQHAQGGGWSYFISGSAEGSDNPMTQSISFATAYAVQALGAALETGAEMPEGLVAEAVDCLERMRNDNGTFVYMLHHASEKSGRATTPASAAGRGPLCVDALLSHGKSDLEELRANLETYLAHHDGLTHQVGRALMHAGPDAEGSHWVLFDYATAAEAQRRLPRAEGAKYRALILGDLLETRRADGSFLDNQVLGRDCGTALALLAFEALR